MLTAVLTGLVAVEGDRVSSMFLFFFIALLIVSPFGYKRIAPILRERRAAAAPPAGAGEAAASYTSGRVVDPDDLANVVELIAAAGRELQGEPGGTRTVDLPAEPLVEGRPATRAVVDALLDDAVRRSGLVAAEATNDGGGRALLLTRR